MIHTNTLITVLKASHQALGPCPTTTQYYDLKTQKQQTELSMIHCDKDYALTQTRTPDHDDTDHLKIEVAPQNDS
jgi:hypothetical protein